MGWGQFFRKFWELVNHNELMALGGQVSYYLLLSFFPLLIFFFTIAGYADISSEKIFEDLKYLLPQDALQIIENIIYEIFTTRSPTLLSVGMLGAIWASMNGINALLRGMGKAYGEIEKRSFLRLLATSLAVLILIALSLIISIYIRLAGTAVNNALTAKLPFFILFLFLLFVFVLLNRMATGTKYRVRSVLPGALFSATGWLFLSLGFSVYFRHFNTYSLTYGSLGGIMVSLLWLYWSSEILLLGCALNAVLINHYSVEKSKVAK